MRAYTMANDRMADNFERFLKYFHATNPSMPLRVIPFDEKTDQIQAVIDRFPEIDLRMVAADPRADQIGKRVFGEREYRPGIPSWRYVRKLNAFIGHDAPFVFLDCNAIALYDYAHLLNELTPLGWPTFLFGSRSAVNRTIRAETGREVLNRLNPGLRAGYCCAFFMSHGGAIDWHVLDAICQQSLAKLIGKSPEQGILAFYIAIKGNSHRMLAELDPRFGVIRPEPLKLDPENKVLRVSSGKRADTIKVSLSFTGQDYHEEQEAIKAFLDTLLANQGNRTP